MFIYIQKNLEEYLPNGKGMGTFLSCLKFLHMLPILKVINTLELLLISGSFYDLRLLI